MFQLQKRSEAIGRGKISDRRHLRFLLSSDRDGDPGRADARADIASAAERRRGSWWIIREDVEAQEELKATPPAGHG